MIFEESYLGRLRQRIGHELVLCPGVQVVVQRSDGSVLVQRRADNGAWEIPAGSCEPGQSFLDAAVAELAEETGIRVPGERLEAFATLSDPELHTLTYPNGDRVHAFALCFVVRDDTATPRAVDGEATAHRWCQPDDLPAPTHPPTAVVLGLLKQFRESRIFQAR